MRKFRFALAVTDRLERAVELDPQYRGLVAAGVDGQSGSPTSPSVRPSASSTFCSASGSSWHACRNASTRCASRTSTRRHEHRRP
jgi:hypothetical protein